MKRYASSGASRFVRYGLNGHSVRVLNHYRGGVRR